ncbi:hypothetical protein PWT90_07804 [Aphanocladium album]|nr:hypothetical protein PWT90_07804 [Aphanocladium album]
MTLYSKEYRLCNPPHYMVPGGPLFLGSILVNADDPTKPLSPGLLAGQPGSPPIAVPFSSLSPSPPFSSSTAMTMLTMPTTPQLGPDTVHRDRYPHRKLRLAKDSSTSFKLGARLKDFISLGPSMQAARPQNRQVVAADLHDLEVTTFEPTDEYIERLLRRSAFEDNVKHFVRLRHSFTLYVVTGLQVVYGRATLCYAADRQTEVEGCLGVGGGGVFDHMLPTTIVGVAAKRTGAASVGMEDTRDRPFVFAYRVHKFDVRKDGTYRNLATHYTGSMLSLDNTTTSDEFHVSLTQDEADGESTSGWSRLIEAEQ